jgi:hypothetical protein
MSEPSDAVKALADHYALTMPDEYPYGFALYMAELALAEEEIENEQS